MKRAAVLLAFVLGASACVHTAPREPVVWPEPPQKARIRFVTSFSSEEDFPHSAAELALRALFGVSGEQPLAQPMGLALSSDGAALYVTDPGRDAIWVARLREQRLERFAPGAAVGRPFAVAVGGDGEVFVTDQRGHQVIAFDRSGRRLRSFGAESLVHPCGIAVDPARRRVYVADPAGLDSPSHGVRIFDLEGHPLGNLGERGGDDGQLYFPLYLAVGPEGDVFVGDTMNFRVQVFDPDGHFLRKMGEPGDGPGMFSRIKGLAFDGFGNLYVADGDTALVQVFNRDLAELTYFAGYAQLLEYLQLPSAIAIDRHTNTIYVADEIRPRVNVYQLVNTTAEDCATPPAMLSEVAR